MTYGHHYPADITGSVASIASSSVLSSSVVTGTRRRAYSAAADLFPATVPAANLSHVRSFPPPQQRMIQWSDTIPTTIAEDDLPPNELQVIPGIEETKEPIDDMELENVFTDSDGEVSPVGVPPSKERADTLTSDLLGTSVFSLGEPPPSHPGDARFLEAQDSNLEEYGNSSMTAVVAPIKPIVVCGCIKLPLCFTKRRISWNRTYLILHV